MGELRAHYKRLCRVNEENPWKRGFGLVAVILLGAVAGAYLAGPGWTWQVKCAAALAVFAGLAWKGISETESESIGAIRDDYKENILDSLVLEPIYGGGAGETDGVPSVDLNVLEEFLSKYGLGDGQSTDEASG